MCVALVESSIRSKLLYLCCLYALSCVPVADSQSGTSTYWNDYPLCSELCHEENFAASGFLLADSCLCTTASWLESVVKCIAVNCPASQLTQSANICYEACSANKDVMAISPAQFVAVGESALSSTPAIVIPPTTLVAPTIPLPSSSNTPSVVIVISTSPGTPSIISPSSAPLETQGIVSKTSPSVSTSSSSASTRYPTDRHDLDAPKLFERQPCSSAA